MIVTKFSTFPLSFVYLYNFNSFRVSHLFIAINVCCAGTHLKVISFILPTAFSKSLHPENPFSY